LSTYSYFLFDSKLNNISIKLSDYKQHKELEKFYKYGIFEENNDWVTQGVIIHKRRPQITVIINSIHLNVINSCEEEAPDLQIGQLV